MIANVMQRQAKSWLGLEDTAHEYSISLFRICRLRVRLRVVNAGRRQDPNPTRNPNPNPDPNPNPTRNPNLNPNPNSTPTPISNTTLP